MRPHPINLQRVQDFVAAIAGTDVHAKRVLSMANATLGVIHAGSLALHAIGHALAQARDLTDKHAIKQVDRLLSNTGVDPWEWFGLWIPYVVGVRTEIMVAMDWTDFDDDDQSTISIHMITSHGRATPLLWKSVHKSALRGWRNDHEDSVLSRLKEVLPAGVKVTVLADRGFGDHKLYELLKDIGFGYVIRFRECITVEDAGGVAKRAAGWIPDNGRPCLLRKAKVTNRRYEVPAVVCVKAPKMKDSWCLVASDEKATASQLVKQYGKRFTIEESYRDTKDIRFGMGMSSISIGSVGRRDRLLMLNALAAVFVTLLGAAGESLGWEKGLKANTAKKRTYSLFTQGLLYYGHIPMMAEDRLHQLMSTFAEKILEQAALRQALGLI